LITKGLSFQYLIKNLRGFFLDSYIELTLNKVLYSE
jgi:hypothetical protein